MLRTLLITALLSSAFLARGEQSRDFDPAKRAAIQKLMAITGAEANQEQLTHTFSRQLITVLQANGMTPDERAITIIREEVDAVVGEQLDNSNLQDRMYRLYARYFTLEEINGLIEFNQSAIGAKANRVMPLLMRESMSAAQDWSEEIGPEISNRVRERLAEEGISLNR